MEENSDHPTAITEAYSVSNAVLLMAFRRPSETSKVISRLREVKPKKIYFAVDGPRADRPEEKLLVQETQKLVSHFDWDCTVETRFLDQNLGCGLGVSSAITWALDSEECVIILEDDVVPAVSFFRFCDELLELYKDDDKVFAVSGENHVPSALLPKSESYRFSSIPNIWGWAVWKRSWDFYELDISGWRKDLPTRELRKSLGGSSIATIWWTITFEITRIKKIDTWDHQVYYAIMKYKLKMAISNKNLTTNIGFGENSTHTTYAPSHLLNAEEANFPLVHPAAEINKEADRWTQVNSQGARLTNLIRGGINLLKILSS